MEDTSNNKTFSHLIFGWKMGYKVAEVLHQLKTFIYHDKYQFEIYQKQGKYWGKYKHLFEEAKGE